MSGHTFNSLKKLYPILSHLFPICRNFLTLYYPKGKISAGVAISSPEGERKRKKRVEGFPFLSFPKFVIGNPNALKTLMDPGLKIAGVTRRWESFPSVIPEIFNRESMFLLFLFVFMFSSFQGGYKGGGAPFIVISPSPFEREKNM